MHQAGNLDAAERLYKECLVAAPKNADALGLLGALLLQQGKSSECIPYLNQAIAQQPNNGTFYTHRGVAHNNLAHYEAALADYDRAILISPHAPDVHNNKGFTLFKLHRYRDAVASYDKAIRANPQYVQAYVNKGEALYELGNAEEALGCYNQALSLAPDYLVARNNRSTALSALRRFAEALEDCNFVLSLNEHVAEFHNNKASALRNLDRLDESIASAERAIAIRANYAEAWASRGASLYQKGQYDEALKSYNRAVEIAPELADVQWNKSLLLLLMGDYTHGWNLYEQRFRTKTFIQTAREFNSPVWRGGESLAGKTILLHAEQGLGDTIQFCRYVPMVEALGAMVVLEVQPPLVAMLGTMPGQRVIVGQGQPLPKYDYHCPLMSLPLAFGTTLETLPAAVPYLYPQEDKQQCWHNRLGHKTNRRIGLVWSGGTVHTNDRNRTIGLEKFLPLLEINAEFHCLQKEVRATDAKLLGRSNIISHVDELSDFCDTAALIMEMDVVITVDTSVAHLAGALGKPVWILVTYVPDFRWLLEREDSPWYPTVRLFRQHSIGNWEGVIQTVAEQLKQVTTAS